MRGTMAFDLLRRKPGRRSSFANGAVDVDGEGGITAAEPFVPDEPADGWEQRRALPSDHIITARLTPTEEIAGGRARKP